MDSFEKQNAKNVLETLKAINRNINYLGRKLELTNDILKKNGVNVLPVIETTTTTKEPEWEEMVRISDIDDWKTEFFSTTVLSENDAKLVMGAINQMINDLFNKEKIVKIDIQKEDE